MPLSSFTGGDVRFEHPVQVKLIETQRQQAHFDVGQSAGPQHWVSIPSDCACVVVAVVRDRLVASANLRSGCQPAKTSEARRSGRQVRPGLHCGLKIEYIREMIKPAIFQARGVERRKKLIQATRDLLCDHHVGQFGLAEVAALAGVPKTSVYHFFPRVEDLLGALAVEVAQDLLAWLDRPIEGSFEEWSQIVAAFADRARAFYDQARAALEIQLGPHTPADIKNRDRQNDMSVAILLKRLMDNHFIVPDLPDIDDAFFRAIEIADLMFMLSVREHDALTDFYVAEAARAANAYLELYLPRILPRRT